MYEVLESIGLSRNESKSYLALLELGLSTSWCVAKQASIDRANAYYSLERLNNKGLVSEVLKKGVKHFEALEPKALKNILLQKEVALNNIMPRLMLKKDLAKNKSEVQIHHGLKALTSILEYFSESSNKILQFGVSKDFFQKLKFFLHRFHDKRISNNVELQQIIDLEAKNLFQEQPLSKTRFSDTMSKTTTIICDEDVVMIIWDSKPISIQIKSKQLSDSYKELFKLMWDYY